ncbi:Late competence development protein ComFB [Thiomicrospira aerophila AL3]|uniref:Late competence development protein ComFB n=1 Tax=Thiomicrospira aerophila AL3 TaxID=717772 RepID=W0DV99_9GAMM|nr:late competence development ComFB family protein [Thiomicrospira aerophila]AHF01178.1 Late competence development protein ComFB [Thiomicrospira aerophila AL3]
MQFDTIHNFYERHVINEITDNYLKSGLNEEQLADMGCIALNLIPPRYIRHDIDMSFYMTPDEYDEIQMKVKLAVQKAFKRVQESNHG